MVEGTLSFIYFIGLYIGWVQPPKLCSGPYFGLCFFFFFFLLCRWSLHASCSLCTEVPLPLCGILL